jgi:hypothetical protein
VRLQWPHRSRCLDQSYREFESCSLRQSARSGHSFPLLISGGKPAEPGLRGPFVRTTRPGRWAHFRPFTPFSASFLRRNRTTAVLVRMSETRETNDLEGTPTVAGSKERRSGGMDVDRNILFGLHLASPALPMLPHSNEAAGYQPRRFACILEARGAL